MSRLSQIVRALEQAQIPPVRPRDPRGAFPAQPLRAGRIIIVNPARPLPLSSAFTDDRLRSMLVRAITIQGLQTNVGNWYVGTSNMSNRNFAFSGVALDSYSFPKLNGPLYDLSQIYIATDNVNDGVTFSCE